MNSILRSLSALLCLALLSTSLHAQAPDSISVQGLLAGMDGDPVADASYSMVFTLYDTLGASIWTETQSVATVDGVYEVTLGRATSLSDVAFDQPLELGIKVGADSEMTPRNRLTSAPYALSLRNLRVVPETAADGPNLIGGWTGNSASGVVGATIAGGGDPSYDFDSSPYPNVVTEAYGTVGGGLGNTAARNATVGGGFSNTASADGGVIGGGSLHLASDLFATIGGGRSNVASGRWATIAGGDSSTASANYAAVGGGESNAATHQWATVGGGASNTATGGWATVGGGASNTASAFGATVPGGTANAARGEASLAAGSKARAIHDGTFVWNDRSLTGGNDSLVSTAPNQFLIRAAGGVGINTDSPGSTLTVDGVVESTTGGFKFPDGTMQTTAGGGGGGSDWRLTGNSGTTAGANFLGTTDTEPFEIWADSSRVMRYEPQTATDGPNVLGGWNGNSITNASGATIAGGGSSSGPNQITDGSGYATISGGVENTVSDDYGTIGGGSENIADGNWTTIGGGRSNDATSSYATVAGGWNNIASNTGATAIGGGGSVAGGEYSVVAGGSNNTAHGDNAFAAGVLAAANNEGSWVWADASGGGSFSSTAANQFLIRATGGVGIGTNTTPSQLTVNGVIESTTGGIKFPDGTLQTTAGGSSGGAAWGLAGNSGTTAGTNYLGTSDNEPFEIKVNAIRVIRYEPETSTEGPNVLAGWSGNTLGSGIVGATIAGGGDPDQASTPRPNSIIGNFGSIGGGSDNTSSSWAVVAGGYTNSATNLYSTVGGGVNNMASGDRSTVAGGQDNIASGDHSSITGGNANTAGGNWAAVPGGRGNRAMGSHSLAAGFHARANHDGAFVWSDRSLTSGNDSLVSTAPNQFLIRAAGGVGIGTSSPGSQLTVNGVIESTTGGVKFPDGTVQTTAGGGGGGSGWSLTGNSGTTAGTNFLGTTDAEPLEVKVDGARVMRYEPETSLEGPNVIGGYSGNTVSGGVVGATIAGGGDPDQGSLNPFNQVIADYGTVGGGKDNIAGSAAVVAGGAGNTATNTAVVSGGQGNEATGFNAVVPGGFVNRAAGEESFAAGYNARALHDNTFVWNGAEGTLGDSLFTTAREQFLINAPGGVGIGTNTPDALLTVASTGFGEDDAIEVLGANGDALKVTNAFDDGIVVVGASGYSLNVKGQKDASATIANHVALLENDATTDNDGPDVLAVKTSATTIDANVNFVTFFDGNDNPVGRIEGNGSGDAVLVGGGADYAEYLPHSGVGESFESGEVVGVHAGRISRRTDSADQVLVVSDRPIVLGNAPPDGQTDGYSRVGFMGQVAIRVTGPVSSGDYIVASGLEDGTAVAISPEDLRLEQLDAVIGRAWESSHEPGVRRVNTAIGLDRTEIVATILKRQQDAMTELQETVKEQSKLIQLLLDRLEVADSVDMGSN